MLAFQDLSPLVIAHGKGHWAWESPGVCPPNQWAWEPRLWIQYALRGSWGAVALVNSIGGCRILRGAITIWDPPSNPLPSVSVTWASLTRYHNWAAWTADVGCSQQGGGQWLRCPLPGCLAGAAPACCVLLRLRPSWSLSPCGGPAGSHQSPVHLLPASCMPCPHTR